ncbi:uncharacterized protein J4E92_006421 [Alternaria infectoria]|uniref:uncharacterized protein n=1 Tax=Alternaria infectoria TaxID=45303 RepID=UPI00221E7DBD|nr:uncharacterized protein J4E92_006421 [Alternaria infectoria]KAI4927254.1 hypothetical protein J4E92_006421 [Alternaria infectoria]
MADIYANSTITIAASASSGPNRGLFRLADSKYVGRPLSSAPSFHMRHPMGHGGRDLPLLQRGWAFQERILSPRILHFAEHELIWECMEYEDCECGSMRLDSLNSPGEYTGGYFQKTIDGEWPATKSHCHPERWRSLKDDRKKIAGSWSRLVRNFSELELSKPNDIFPAISGIAKSFREATGWEYVAGMWKEGLIQNLSWYTSHPAIRCKIWRAPTFSWASLQFPEKGKDRDCIAYEHMDDIQELATVVEAKSSPKGADPTGQLEDAYIILSGTMIQATVDKYFIKPLQSSTQSIEPLTSSETHDTPSTEMSSIRHRNRDHFTFHADFYHRLEPGANVHCLKLLEAKWQGKNAAYLVLSKKSSTPWDCNGMKGECEFERLGLMESRLQKDKFHPKIFEEESPEHAFQHNAVVKIV